MSRTTRQVKKRIAQAERDRDARRMHIAEQRQLSGEVKQLWTELSRNGTPHPSREELVTLSSVEALVDQLVELQLIDRLRHNVLTFTNLKRRLLQHREAVPKEEAPVE